MRPNPIFSPAAVRALDDLFAAMRSSDCVIERPATGRSVGGAPITSWTPVATTKCRVKGGGLMSVESLAGGRYGPDIGYIVRIRRDPGTEGFAVQSDDRITVNGEHLFVTAAVETPTYGWELEIPCRSQS